MKSSFLAILLTLSSLAHAADFRGAQFISFDKFTDFTREETTLASPFTAPEIPWDELVLSWNMTAAGENGLHLDLEYRDPSGAEFPPLRLATWRAATNRFSQPVRKNRPGQIGYIDTDTFKLPAPTRGHIRVRLTFIDGATPAHLKFLALSFRDSTARPAPLEPNRRAWGKTIQVRPRSQLDYPEGAKIWCSPTSTSMLLDHWSQQLRRPELNLTVPETARAVHDTVYQGTGNWPFNTAFAANFPGLRAYVTRLTDVSELEDWIEAGIPVITSVSYNRLKGRNTGGSGHLIVCVGFTPSGDIIVNDPGTRLDNVRRDFPRDLFRQAWADSGNTVYLIHPENASIPPARHSHWEHRPH